MLMDIFTRAIRGWHLDRSFDQNLTLTALRKALKTHRPESHHSDQGLQYAATDYTALLSQHGIQPYCFQWNIVTLIQTIVIRLSYACDFFANIYFQYLVKSN